jgi:hypothetical protein
MEENNVTVEETTEVIEPETNTEEAEASEKDTPSEETSEAEEAETETAEAEPAKPKRTSRASERIRELIAQKKALEAQLRQKEPEIEGVDDTGIDPNRFADSLERRTARTAQTIAQSTLEYYRAEQDFPLVKENNLVRSRAGELVDQGYSPIQAAEIASLEWHEITGQEIKKTTQRKQAASNLRAGAQIPQAGKKVSTSGMFTRSEIDRMKPAEYVKNQAAIQAQLEKYGPESFE